MRQDELAGAAGVGLRFIVELEGGKPTVQIGKTLQVSSVMNADAHGKNFSILYRSGSPRLTVITWPAAFTSDRVNDSGFAIGSVPVGRPRALHCVCASIRGTAPPRTPSDWLTRSHFEAAFAASASRQQKGGP